MHRSAKVFGAIDVELTQFANIDGERTKVMISSPLYYTPHPLLFVYVIVYTLYIDQYRAGVSSYL